MGRPRSGQLPQRFVLVLDNLHDLRSQCHPDQPKIAPPRVDFEDWQLLAAVPLGLFAAVVTTLLAGARSTGRGVCRALRRLVNAVKVVSATSASEIRRGSSSSQIALE